MLRVETKLTVPILVLARSRLGSAANEEGDAADFVKKGLGTCERLPLFCMARRRRLTRSKPPV